MAEKTTAKPAVVGREKLDTLDPVFRTKAHRVVEKLRQKGWHLRLVWARRTQQENDELVTKGVASKHSKHLTGKALDLIDRHTGYTNDRNHKYYKDLEAAAKEVNVTWGGGFKNRWDPCHIEAMD